MKVADFCVKAFPHFVKHMLFEMQEGLFPAGPAALPVGGALVWFSVIMVVLRDGAKSLVVVLC